jgi:hypothetical protein
VHPPLDDATYPEPHEPRHALGSLGAVHRLSAQAMSQVRPGNMMGVCVTDTVGVGDFVCEKVGVTDRVAVNDVEEDRDGDMVADDDAVRERLGLSVTEGVTELELDVDGDTVGDSEAVRVTEGVLVDVAVTVGDWVDVCVVVAVALKVGEYVGVIVAEYVEVRVTDDEGVTVAVAVDVAVPVPVAVLVGEVVDVWDEENVIEALKVADRVLVDVQEAEAVGVEDDDAHRYGC